MKKTFAYLRPRTPVEAYGLKARYGKKSRFWAGGTDLLLQWQDESVSLDYCIDLSFIPDLDFIRKDSDAVSIGALTKVASVEASSELNHSLSIIREAAGELAAPQIRNTATIGGNTESRLLKTPPASGQEVGGHRITIFQATRPTC